MKESSKILCTVLYLFLWKRESVESPYEYFTGSSKTKFGTCMLKDRISTQLHSLVMKTFITKQKNIHVFRVTSNQAISCSYFQHSDQERKFIVQIIITLGQFFRQFRVYQHTCLCLFSLWHPAWHWCHPKLTHRSSAFLPCACCV